MLFKKKKVVNELSPTYEKIRDLYKDLFDCRQSLESWTRKCYIRNAAMCCYIPMEPDWNAQGERLRHAQSMLRAAMGAYDDLRQQIINLIKKEPSNWAEPQESHEVVEWELERIFRK